MDTVITAADRVNVTMLQLHHIPHYHCITTHFSGKLNAENNNETNQHGT